MATEVTHEVKSVKNEGEVIFDNDRGNRERNPELDQLLEYLSTMSEMMLDEVTFSNLTFSNIKNFERIKKSLEN